MEIQCLFEESLNDGGGISGASLDLSKTYNTIDREVLWKLAKKCGWPNELIVSWVISADSGTFLFFA